MNTTVTVFQRVILNQAGRTALLAAIVSLALPASVFAAPIIDEGFDYPGGGASLAGNDGGTGWSDPWVVFVAPELTGDVTVETGSLSLGSYATTGNRVRITATASIAPASTEFVNFNRNAGTGVGSVGGEMWQSFLYKRIDDTFNGFDTVNNVGDGVQDEIRISTNFEMRIRPNRQNIDGPQLRYKVHALGEEIEAPIVNDGDTFLFVARWEDLGNTDPVGGPARKAQMWVLDAAGYDAVAAGSTLYDEAVQINNATHGGTEETMLNAGDQIAMFHLYKDRAAVLSEEFTTEWDEIRYGDSIDDILPGFTTANIGVPAAILAADFDEDDDVDGQDFLAWQRGLGMASPGLADGDADGNGTVDAVDLGIWEGEFGAQPLASSTTVVPEPSTCLLAGLACLSLAEFRRRPRKGGSKK